MRAIDTQGAVLEVDVFMIDNGPEQPTGVLLRASAADRTYVLELPTTRDARALCWALDSEAERADAQDRHYGRTT